MVYAASRELEAEEARKLDERRKLREERRDTARLSKENKELARKFSKVEGVYRAGAAVRRVLRKAKRGA